MNNFTVCNNQNTWHNLWQKRITSLTERMKTFTPPGKFMLLALLCLLMTENVVGQRKMLVKTGSSFNSKKRNPRSHFFFLAFSAMIMASGSILGQVSLSYTFSSTSGTYTALSSSTTLFSPTWNNDVSSVTIPFNFIFNGTYYNSCYVSTNGFITFGSTTPTNNYSPISSSESYSGAISAFGRDLASSTSGNNIVYGTEGTAPSRTFVIQWINAQRYYNSSLRNGNYNFQIRLSEGTNVIQIKYGSCSTNYTTDLPVQVGLRGSSSGDYNNRTTTSNWANTSAGGSNSSTCTTKYINSTSSVNPTSGLTYTWTPKVPTITSLGSSSGCEGTTITINGTNLSGATAVKIGGTAVASITSNSGTVIKAVIGSGTTGTVTVTTAGGTAISAGTFTVNTAAAAAGTITGTENVCQGSTNIVYTVPAISGATSYVWSYLGAGATLNGTANTVVTTTNSVSINFSATATTGFLNVKGKSPCGDGTVSPNFAIQVNSLPPNPIREIITHENCPGDKDGAIKLKIPTALRFDGPIPGVTKAVSNLDGNPIYNDGVNLNGSFLNNLTEFTVEGWVNTDVTVGNVALFGQNNVVEVGFLNNKVELYSIGIRSGNCVSNIDYPIDGKWHHIAGTGDYTRMKIYIDGILQREWVYDSPPKTDQRVTNYGSSTYLTRIGRQVFDDTDLQPFTGQIVKVGFWNRALTQAEITALAGGGFHDYTTTDAGLIAGYNFYETTGDVTLEPVSNPAATTATIPMGTLVNTPRWNEVYNYAWIKTDGGTYGGAATKNIKLIERGDYNVTVASKYGCGTNSETFTVNGKNNYWTGAVSTNWGDAANWTCGVVKEGYSVEFATSTNNPTKPASKNLELLDASHTINNLTNATSLATVIPPARSLTVQGKVTGSETDPSKILIQANATQPNGSLIFTDPSKNPAVKATVQMYTRGYKGTDLWTWTDPAGGKYSGYYRWQFFGVPVKITDILYNNSSLWGSYIRKYEENKNLNSYYQKWTDVGNNDTLTAFTGYEITQPAAKAISFQGELVTGDRTLTLTKSTGTGTLNYGSGYNIFGNSFTAAIDISKIQFPAEVDKTVYLYNTGSLADWGNNGQTLPTDGGTGFVGSYYSIPQNTSPVVGKEIPSMQGFLLKTTTNGAQVTIPYNSTTSSVTANTTKQKVKHAVGTSGDVSYMTVDVTGAGGVDRVWLFSQPETSHRFDNGWDGEKILLATGIVLYADEETGKYQVNTAADLDETYLAFRAGNESDYTLKVDKSKLNGYETLYLQDLITGTEINLSAVDTASYQFSASNGQNAEKRFVLTRRSKTAIDYDRESLNKIYTAGNTILLNNESDASGVAGVFDLTGKQLYSATYQPKQLKRLDLNLPEGVYMVNAKSEGVNVVQRILISGKK